MDPLDKMLELARDGCTVSLAPAPEPLDGVQVTVDLGDVHGRQLIGTHELDSKAGSAAVVGYMLERIMRDVGDLLERELRGHDG